MLLRPEQAGDHPAVAELHRAAFGAQGAVVAELVDDLRNLIAGDTGLSIVAEDYTADGPRIVGHVLFTPALLDAPRQLVPVQVLSPLGVLPRAQRRGIGTALVRHGLTELARLDVPVVFLEGSPDYYPRLGFAPAAAFDFRKPSLRIPDRAFQAVRLPAHRDWMTGTLVYPPQFWRHDCVGRREPAGSG